MSLVRLDIKAPQPLLVPAVATQFNLLRADIKAKTGHDFLAVCGDMFRDEGFTSSKDGVANRSRHKTARVFDYNQEDARLVIVKEPIGNRMYFRTYLKCVRQDGTQGELLRKRDFRGFTVGAYLVDFTARAEAFGFTRIPAWNGWEKSYNRMEFWHYEKNDGLTWNQAMDYMRKIRSAKFTTPNIPIVTAYAPNINELVKAEYGRNDRGEQVRKIQGALVARHLLPAEEIDGVFGVKTYEAVRIFQRQKGLNDDGIVGKLTRAKLFAF